MKAILLAGGKGRRLKPFTTTIPKPLFPIGEKPILQIIIEQLKEFGVDEYIISLGHLGELIKAFLGDGEKYNTKISYVTEETPLGTAGAISLLPELNDDYIFMNGDILSTIDFTEAYNDHKKSKALMTICTFEKTTKSSLGVLELNINGEVENYLEKPELKQIVSSGIYILNPGIKDYIPQNTKYDLPDLVKSLINKKKKINTYAIKGDWFDIGTPSDLEKAEQYLSKK